MSDSRESHSFGHDPRWRPGGTVSPRPDEFAARRPPEVGDLRWKPASPSSRELLLILLLLLVSWGVQSFVVLTHRIPTNADQAIVGLMAKHIAEGKGHPVFYYGSTYAGSVEPHFLAGVFSILGPSPEVYRLAMGFLVAATLLGVYAVTRRFFGVPAATFALGYLALPPFFFLYKGLTSDGHYNAFNLVTLVALLLALGIDENLAKERKSLLLFGGLGFAIGLGWWVNPITPAVSAAVLVWLFIRTPPRPPVLGLVPLFCGFVVGSSPWWIWNLRHDWASLKAPELGILGAASALRNLVAAFTTSVPTLAAGMVPNTLPQFAQETFPFSRVLSLAAIGALLLPAALRAVRGDRRRGLLLLVLGALLVAAALSQRFVSSEPRFLLPYYVIVPPLVGAALARLLAERRLRLLGVVCTLLAVLHAANIYRARVSFRNVENEVTGSLDSLIRLSQAAGIGHLYADYWTAYRVSFESRERIVATPIPGEEFVRYAPYQEAAARAPSAGIALLPPRSRCFEAYLREADLRFAHFDADEFRVFYSLPPVVLDFVRSRYALPLPAEAYRVSWEIGEHPTVVTAGRETTARVAFRNTSPCPWPPAVHLGYHWRPVEAGLPAIFDGGRALPNRRIAPGEGVELEVALNAPPAPGSYTLEYDLVFENVEWFSTRAGAMARLSVTVRP